MKSKRWMATAFLIVMSLLLAACSPSDDTSSTTEPDGGTATTEGGATDTTEGDTTEPTEPAEDVTLRVLVHQNPDFIAYMEGFNADFEAANPGVTIDMTILAPGDMATAINTRLSAGDVDVIDFCPDPCAAFANPIQPFMSDVEKPLWQQLIEAGLVMDITDEAFVQNYDQTAVADAGSFDGSVYAVPMGRVSYSGMFVNNDLLSEVGVALPTTWSELVTACDTIVASGNFCMTVGGADTWPIFVGAYGLLGSVYPDQADLNRGLWEGDIKWNDAKGLELYDKFQVYATEMLEPGVTGLGHDAATARYAAGDVAFMPTGVWQAGNLDRQFEEGAEAFDWTYVPFPGSDNAEDNQYLFGKYDASWMIAEGTPNRDVAVAYLEAFSDPATYEVFANAVNFLPTQPTATLNTTLGQAVAPLLENYRVGFEQYWVAPKGAGQWANGSQAASWFQPFNEWDDSEALANQSQADLEAGLG